jgi:predicted CXXCH cytochrome family protein
MKTLLSLTLVLVVAQVTTARDFVGSQTCQTCHDAIHNDWSDHGHPYKFNVVNNGTPPTYPHPQHAHLPENPPQGFAWSNITAVLGGFYWKTRFLDSDGYIATTGYYGVPTQWNCLVENWSNYDATVPTRVPYNYSCFRCHTTGPVSADSADVANHWNQKPGIWGTWAEAGVGCEACHGPGSEHVTTMNPDSINMDQSASLCGTCHLRPNSNRISVSGGWLMHRQQNNSLALSPHSAMSCNQCHDPHKSVVFGLGGVDAGATCTNCHNQREYRVAGMADLACSDCHMAKWVKNGQTFNSYMGDESTHFFTIRTDETPRDSLYYTEGSSTFVEIEDGRVSLPLDITCFGCHDAMTLAEASDFADNIHVNHPVSVDPRLISTTPQSFELSQNFPNPFNAVTTIPFAVMKSGHVKLSVYNVLGQEVASLVDGDMLRGAYRVQWDASNVSGGMYVARLVQGDESATTKVLLMK